MRVNTQLTVTIPPCLILRSGLIVFKQPEASVKSPPFHLADAMALEPSQPLVSVITPVYNGDRYLVECIESVLAQTYQNWEYIIVNNCSTDRTLDIANLYTARDKRIQVVSCHTFVGVTENHNRALRLLSPKSKYCKVVSADDWIYPESLTELVAVGEAYPSVGIVGSYTITGKEVRWLGVPLQTRCIQGYDICRLYLNGRYTFGAPSALLYRASVVRETDPFFPGLGCSADSAACLAVLRCWDFGFVHKILSFERVHEGSITSHLATRNSFLLDRIDFLLRYGQYFLSGAEQNERLDALLGEYYRYLAVAVVNFRERSFWDYHRTRLNEIGLTFSKRRMAKATVVKLLELGLNFQQTACKVTRLFNRHAQRPATNFAKGRVA